MPVLQQASEKLDKIYLPSSKDAPNEEDRAWVVMDISPLLTGDASNVDGEVKNGGEATMQMLAARIREWNFTESDGAPADIDFAHIKRLKMEDFQALQEAIEEGEGAITEEERNLSSSTSSPAGKIQNIPVTDSH